jgi:SAM-dependent methyltransferase
MDRTQLADVVFTLDWESQIALHRERQFVHRVNFWRDLFPGSLSERLARTAVGDEVRERFAAGEVVAPYDAAKVRSVARAAFGKQASAHAIEPRVGRFYPRAWAAGALGTFAADYTPLRVIGCNDGILQLDMNHPLARSPIAIRARVVAVLPEREERGGSANDIGDLLTRNGPGMQAPVGSVATDFFAEYPFARADESDDARFYAAPRFVQHLDSAAIGEVTAIYGRILASGARVLDLMSSWVSHLPRDRTDLAVAGLGMNRDELDRNPRLAERVVQDLNATPRVPFNDGEFDAVICTVSVEYLVRPREVFAEIARVLKPGGVFVNTFSERWFPPKVIRLWTELHPFERLGLVLESYRRTGAFRDLRTETVRGLPRPAEDKYAATLAFSDPIYAVWGMRR